jgi:hypothetical protein
VHASSSSSYSSSKCKKCPELIDRVAIYNLMVALSEAERETKLREAHRSMLFYLIFYSVLTLIMCVLDFFRRIELLNMKDATDEQDDLALSFTCL